MVLEFLWYHRLWRLRFLTVLPLGGSDLCRTLVGYEMCPEFSSKVLDNFCRGEESFHEPLYRCLKKMSAILEDHLCCCKIYDLDSILADNEITCSAFCLLASYFTNMRNSLFVAKKLFYIVLHCCIICGYIIIEVLGIIMILHQTLTC